MKRIVMKFKEDGTIETDAEGFSGKICVTETDRLLKSLNATVQERKLKREYNEVKQKATVDIQSG